MRHISNPVSYNNLELCVSLQKIPAKKIRNIFNRICGEVQKLTNDNIRLIFDDEYYLSVVLIEKTYGGDWFVLESYYSSMTNRLPKKYKIIYGLMEFFWCIKKYAFNNNSSRSYACMNLRSLASLKSVIESESYEELEIQMTIYGI